MAVLGPSGSGKSTLLSMCNLMRTPDSGEVNICGKEVREWNVSELRRTAALAFQSAPVLDGTVRDNLSLVQRLHQSQLYSPEELCFSYRAPARAVRQKRQGLIGRTAATAVTSQNARKSFLYSIIRRNHVCLGPCFCS